MKLKSLTDEIMKAIKKNADWTSNELTTVVEAWKKTDHSLKIDWDTGAGENWVSFFLNYERIGMLGVSVPILFLDSSYAGANDKCQLFKAVHVVHVDDFDAKEWFMDMEQFNKLVPELSWRANIDAVNPNSMSINDFWFETITI
jgi:hypothetical protein